MFDGQFWQTRPRIRTHWPDAGSSDSLRGTKGGFQRTPPVLPNGPASTFAFQERLVRR